MRSFFRLIPATILILATVACGASAGESGAGGGGAYDTQFPLPASVKGFTDTGNDSINFQTNSSLEDTVEFYRAAFSEAGLSERSITTAITETTFSLVFDGDPSGKAVVVQGVDLGNGTTNVNIRYEDV
jgi:hypothetical protein